MFIFSEIEFWRNAGRLLDVFNLVCNLDLIHLFLRTSDIQVRGHIFIITISDIQVRGHIFIIIISNIQVRGHIFIIIIEQSKRNFLINK